MKAHLVESPAGNRIAFEAMCPKEIKALKELPCLFKGSLPVDARVVDFCVPRLKAATRRGVGTTLEVVQALEASRVEQAKPVELPPEFYYHTKPLPHQEVALKAAIASGSIGLLLDPGLGKTKVTLDYAFYLKATLKEKFTKVIIICPKALLRVWQTETLKHRPELKVHVVRSVSQRASISRLEEKLASGILDEKKTKVALRDIKNFKASLAEENELFAAADVIVINYAKVTDAAERLARIPWSLCAVDEGLIKDPSSLRTKAVLKVGRASANRLILSGTLINQGPEDVFAPVQFIEPSIFGTSFWNFNQHYGIYVKKGGDSKDKFLVGYKKEGRDEIRRGLELVSIVMSKDEWLKDLPPKCPPVYISVPLSAEQQSAYDDLLGNYICTLPEVGFVEVDNPLSCLCKLQQISSGFLYFEEDREDLVDVGLLGESKKEKGPRQTYFFKENPKAQALKELLQREDFKTRRFVLWYNMGAELEIVTALLQGLGVTYRVVNGATKDSGLVVEQFNSDPSIQVLVSQAKSINYGVTILGTDLDSLDSAPELDPGVYTQVFYSLNYSLEVYLQQLDRVHRIGVVRSPEYYFLRTVSDIEDRIISALEQKLLIRKEFLVDILRRDLSK